MKLSVIETGRKDDFLVKLLRKLEKTPGYGLGLQVMSVPGVLGKYALQEHNGELNVGVPKAVRIYKGNIIVAGAKSDIMGLLEEENIPFKQYDDILSPEQANQKSPKIRLPLTPDYIYQKKV